MAPTLVPAPFRPHQRWPHGGRCAGAQTAGARTIYKDERLQALGVSSGQRDGEPAGSGPTVSQILQLLNIKNKKESPLKLKRSKGKVSQVSKTVMARLAVVAMAVAVAVAQEGSGVGLPAGHEDILTK